MNRLFAQSVCFAAGMALCFAAAAQQYKWVDKDGRVQYGDSPPPGVKATPLRAPAGPAAPPAGAKAKALSPAEKEADYRKRQAEAAKAHAKQEAAAQDEKTKKENCARAQEHLRTVESGQRLTRTDASGERYYLDDAQIAQEGARARKGVADWCN